MRSEPGKVPDWNPEAVWSVIDSARQKDRRRWRVARRRRLLAVAATVMLLLAGAFTLKTELNSVVKDHPISPLARLEFTPVSTTSKISVQRLNKALAGEAMQVNPSSQIATADLVRQPEKNVVIPPALTEEDTVAVPFRKTIALLPKRIPEITAYDSSEPFDFLVNEQSERGSHATYYLPLPLTADSTATASDYVRPGRHLKPTLKDVLIGIVPFLKRKDGLKTQLMLDGDLNLTLRISHRDSL